MVVRAWNPSYLEVEIRRIVVQSQPWQKKSQLDPISTSRKLGVVVSTCHTSHIGSVNMRIMVQVKRM
jgi:hypothetical protein